jgi:hypothetical protein
VNFWFLQKEISAFLTYLAKESLRTAKELNLREYE